MTRKIMNHIPRITHSGRGQYGKPTSKDVSSHIPDGDLHNTKDAKSSLYVSKGAIVVSETTEMFLTQQHNTTMQSY